MALASQPVCVLGKIKNQKGVGIEMLFLVMSAEIGDQ
jgi:hypothetical protein